MRPTPLPICAAVLCALGVRAAPVDCPETIAVRQQIAAEVPGWKASLDEAPHRLAHITFFDGPPEKRASLVYDRFVRNVATWSFGPEQRIWLACAYSGTSVVLQRPLPPGTKACSVVYASKAEIRKMDCK
jgi:hypothetical protein